MHKVLLSVLAVATLAGCAEMKTDMDKMMGIEVKAKLIACPTKVAIGDVPSCGKVWKLGSGSAELKKDGSLTAEVKGLVLNDASTGTSNGTPDGVDGVAAIQTKQNGGLLFQGFRRFGRKLAFVLDLGHNVFALLTHTEEIIGSCATSLQ